MWQTIKDIEKEIEVYNARVGEACKALSKLVNGYLDYGEHKCREAKRTALESEIKTVKQIIVYAKEAIDRQSSIN